MSVLLGEQAAREPADGFGMSDAVTSALVTVAQKRPVVVVVDDLHWADPSSVRLLEFVARHTCYERLLLIGTYRDVEVETTDHPPAPLMLPLLAKATTVTLTGLGRADVAALMARTAGVTPDDGWPPTCTCAPAVPLTATSANGQELFNKLSVVEWDGAGRGRFAGC